jgi:pimeloyl-ACP methyl ester carboxylesterase
MATGNRFGLRMIYAAAARHKTVLTKAAFDRHLTRSGVDLTRRIFQRSLADLKGNYGPIQDMLADLDQPTLVLWGNRDPFFSTAVAERTRSALRNATLKIYENTGHFVPEERPDLVAQDIRSFFDASHA